MNNRWTSPLRYPGGKVRMAPFLAGAFAAQWSVMDIEIFLEPFAGGLGAGLKLLEQDAVDELWFAEKHPALAAFWQAVIEQPDELIAAIRSTTPTLETFYAARELVGSPIGADRLDLARSALVLNRCSRSGIIASNVGPIGGKTQKGRWTVASRWNADGLVDRITRIAAVSDRMRYLGTDAIGCIADLNGSGIEDEVFLFVDPPYVREGNRLYANGFAADDHQALADALNDCPAHWMLTYDDEPLVADSLYPDRRIVEFEIPHTANRARIDTEYLVLSDGVMVPESFEPVPGSRVRWLGAA
ncbi:DNA adenine methylase [Yimella lutea]|uniref:DNA adenine methylase n=1 Tax=Yimella lutea TaxID=587872 RepID=A0A542EGU1_9MICO|nr:DNA adenine methylase [Yimella lutea]TQJ14557.1 DNA adenine methylase [Yimella lutea]